jgi:hypothetical protein
VAGRQLSNLALQRRPQGQQVLSTQYVGADRAQSWDAI